MGKRRNAAGYGLTTLLVTWKLTIAVSVASKSRSSLAPVPPLADRRPGRSKGAPRDES